MSAKLISNWSFTDSAFFPYSLHSIGDNAKMVLIVPGEGQIFTLVIKNLQQNIQSDGSPHKVSRIKLTDPDSSLVETVVTSMNTVSRKDNGELVVFSSFRECTAVEGMSGVRAICSMDDGKKVLLVRLIRGRNLQLEVFDDLSGCQIGHCLKSFDLSWERNEFDTSRDSQVHKVQTIVIDKENSKMFRRFLNCRDLSEGTELILFTMDNGLYWLKTLENSYEIVTIKLYPALILDFNFAPSTDCFAVLLANAVMNVYSISEDAESLLIQEDNRHLGPSIESHLFITELSTLLYSSGSHITQIRYYFSELSKSIQHIAKEIPITGVTGITYLGFAELAICVTENRLFYSVPVSQLTDYNGNQQNDYFELTSEILSQANQMTCFLTNEVNVENRITKEIGQERLQVGILTSAINQDMYKNFLAADLKYHKYQPPRCYSTLILGDISSNSNIYVQIDISLKNGIKEVMISQKNWILGVSIDDVVTQIPLSKVNYIEDSTIRLLVPVDEHRFRKQGLPHIEISMVITVNHCQDSIALDIPLQIRNNEDIADLFEASSHEIKTMALERHLPTVAGSLIQHCEQLPVISPPTIEFRLEGLKDVSSVDKLLRMLEFATIPSRVDETLKNVYIGLGNQICEIQCGEQDEFRFRSDSPGMLFLLKVLCNKKCKHMSSINADKLKALKAIQLQLMQCETSESEREHIVSYYRQIRTSSGTWR